MIYTENQTFYNVEVKIITAEYINNNSLILRPSNGSLSQNEAAIIRSTNKIISASQDTT